MGTLLPVFFFRGGAEVEIGEVIGVLGSGCNIISIGWKRVNTTCGNRGGLGGSRYHIEIPKVKLGKLRVAITGFLTMLDGGKRKEIVWTGSGSQ